MFVINEDKSIYITRGDVAFFSIEAKTDTGEKYKFMPGDVVRFKVCERKACENVVLSKDFGIETEAEEVSIYLEEKDTKFGEVISKPVEYWYEVELNPYTDPQTILGYDEDGAKVFRLFPEGNEKEDDDPITPEDIPVVDEELDLTSTRPVQNQAIARAILKINDDVKAQMDVFEESVDKRLRNMSNPTDDGDAVNLGFIKSHCIGTERTVILTHIGGGKYKLNKSAFPNETILQIYSDDNGTYIFNMIGKDEVLIYNWQKGEALENEVMTAQAIMITEINQ